MTAYAQEVFPKEQKHEQEPEASPAEGPGYLGAAMTPAGAFARQTFGGNDWVKSLLSSQAGPEGLGSGLDFLDLAAQVSGENMCRVDQPPAADQEAENDRKIDDAISKVTDRMSYGLFDWAVTDNDARESIKTLSDLPPELQGKAIAKMDKTSFDRLLENTTQLDKESFKTLMDNTHDPERKLKLWAEYHKAKVANDADRDKKDEGGWWGKTDEQKQNIITNDQRKKIVDSNNKEVQDEVDAAMKQLADGKLTEKDVQSLIDRKTKEADIERKYNINLTNDFGQKGDKDNPSTERRTWSSAELDQISGALDRMPPGDVTNKSSLREIRREASAKEKDAAGNWTDRKSTGADAGGGRIRVFDTGTGWDPAAGTNKSPAPWRTQANSELAGHLPGGTGNKAPLSLIEEVLTHEVGHTVHQGDNALWNDWRAINGWENLGKDALRQRLIDDAKANGKSQADAEKDADKSIGDMEAKRKDHYGSRPTVTSGAKTYEVNPYGGDFLGVQKGAIPGGTEWGYALSNPEDHFAEVYAKAIHQPEGLYKDLVSGPKSDLNTKEGKLKDQKDRIEGMKAAGATPDEIKKEEELQKTLETEVADARAAAETRQKQWDFFRQRVFKTDDKDIQALNAPPGKEDVYKEYKAKATMCQTPQQLADLRAAYKDKL